MPRNRSYSVRYKLNVIQWHTDNGRNVSQTAREFGIDRKRVRDWVAKEGELQMHRRGSAGQKKRIGTFYYFYFYDVYKMEYNRKFLMIYFYNLSATKKYVSFNNCWCKYCGNGTL